MRANPELYDQLKDKTTKLGVNIGHCIKTGIDNKGKAQSVHREFSNEFSRSSDD